MNVVHRDIKPQNILKHNGNWFLIDFGISKNQERVVTKKTFQGYVSRGFAAPEQFDGVEAKPSADIYSFGKLLVFMLTGQTDVDMVQYPVWRTLISRCVAISPDERPAIESIIGDLEAINV